MRNKQPIKPLCPNPNNDSEYYRNYRETHRKQYREYKRKYRQTHPEQRREYARRYEQSYPEARKAQCLADYHVLLESKCLMCHSTEDLQRAHLDYQYPLLVFTLCRKCHYKFDHIPIPEEYCELRGKRFEQISFS